MAKKRQWTEQQMAWAMEAVSNGWSDVTECCC